MPACRPARATGWLLFFCLLGLAAWWAGPLGAPALAAGSLAALALAGMVGDGGTAARLRAGLYHGTDGKPRAFVLSHLHETIVLEPGKSWIKVDAYKWVTRGLIEPPQSYHVLPDGTVDINDHKIKLQDADGTAKLEEEINKRHIPASPHGLATAAPKPHAVAESHPPDKIVYRVRLDRLGHLFVECFRGEEHAEAGLRGLAALAHDGWLRPPRDLHVDALQRYVELDGVKFECTEPGARQMEEALNAHYAPDLQAASHAAIEVKENPASPSGFDIHFVTTRASLRQEIRGHLTQERLDILQDNAKCDLLQPSLLLRLSPPYLLIRRKRADGGEERVPELPDIYYRRANAVELERVLNHPLVRRQSRPAGSEVAEAKPKPAVELALLRLVRNPHDPHLLWLEGRGPGQEPVEFKAFTHHNLVDLQHRGVFQPHLDVMLSFDNRTLRVQNREAHQHESVIIEHASSDAELEHASQMLTAALKPPTLAPSPPESPPPAAPEVSVGEPAPVEAASVPDATAAARVPPVVEQSAPPPAPAVAPPVTAPAASLPPVTAAPVSVSQPPASATPEASLAEVRPDTASEPEALAGPVPAVSPWLALFQETDPVRVNVAVFRHLGPRLGLPVHTVYLSLPMVFENRRFEILSFGEAEFETVLDLRNEQFRGFYLSCINEQNILLVYACQGRHVEWGPRRCLLQPAVTVDPEEYRGSALLGLAQDREGAFVFVVQAEYSAWAKPREKPYQAVGIRFVTVEELAANPDNYTLIWPEPAA